MKNFSANRSGTEITIRDVATTAGVSIRTVSRVLNRSPKVNKQTREKIEAAIAELSFRPSARARGLATGRSFLIGMVHNDQNALVLDPAQRGVVAVASQRGYELVVHPTPFNQQSAVEDVLNFVNRSRVDGVLVMPPVSDLPGLSQALMEANIPAAAISSVRIDGFPAMLVSEERQGAAAVARYLISLGHARIAMIAGPHGVFSAAERRAGFVSALVAAGLGLVGEVEGDYGFDSGVAAARRLMQMEPRPTAIFAANDVMAAGVLKIAAELRIPVPEMLSVVGFDGSILARMLTPALTTVRRPFDDMAGAAVQHLIDMIEDGAEPAELTRSLDLIEGESSGPAAN